MEVIGFSAIAFYRYMDFKDNVENRLISVRICTRETWNNDFHHSFRDNVHHGLLGLDITLVCATCMVWYYSNK